MEQTLGKRIAAHRKRLNMTQDQLAEQLGITAQAISKWENDLSCPDITMLPRLAEIFDISIDELLGHSAPEKVHDAEVVFEEDQDDSDNEKDRGRVVVHWSAGKRGATIGGLMVLAVGVLLLLARIYHWEVSFWSILWPCAMIAYSLDHMLKKFSVFSLALGLFGVYFLVNNLGIWQLGIDSELYFPIIIVMLGLGLLVDAMKKPKKSGFRVLRTGNGKKKTESKFHNTNSSFDCDLSFGERTHVISATCLKSGIANVSFGELTLDLTQGEAVDENCTIDANCSFGELILLVPNKFRVEQDSSTSFASCDVQGYPSINPLGVIQLDCSASFGSVLIKYV